LSSEKLLIVDGDIAAQSTSSILNTHGYTVLTAECTEHALAVLRGEPQIELVAAALSLPGGECGADLIGKIRLSYRSTAVMLMARPEERNPDPALPVILTPFSAAGLLNLVENLLAENRQVRAALRSTLKRHHVVRDEVHTRGESLRETVQWSRRHRAERFCSALRLPGVRPPVVLVVDDDFVLRYAICRFLTQQGFQVLAAASAEEALTLSRAHQGQIDLLLTDFRMPGMTGGELIEAMGLERPLTRTLMMTGDDLRLPRQVLRKPFEMEDLLSEIATILVRSAPH
jgi:CheY-like chemotaxis protein